MSIVKIRTPLLLLAFVGTYVCLNACGGGQVNSPANTNTTQAGNASSVVYPPLAAGLAEAEFENLDGSKFKISERKGKVLLLNIWGIWCGPCRAEMPHLAEMYDKYRDKGFEVIGLNIGDAGMQPEAVEKIKQFAENFNPRLTYPMARSSGASTAQFYQVTKQSVVPQSLLVDREGKLRGMFIGGGPNVIQKMKETVEKTMAE